MEAWIVDTFADDRYRGNPAGVIRLPAGFPDVETMQAIAFRLGLPTTAFIVPDQTGEYRIRWFTPEKELNLCGHATIASAGYLYEVERISHASALRFHTNFGPLDARREDAYVFLKLPCLDTTACEPPPGLEEALAARIVYCARAIDDILMELESEETVAELRPDFARLRQIDCRGHVVTARSSKPGVDFVSRSFFPALGVNEDQVCVSAHCKLGPYWARQLGKSRLFAVQLSDRGGQLVLDVTREHLSVAGTAIIRRSVLLERVAS